MSVTRLVQQFIAQRPSVKDCLRLGLVNYSALAREICKASGSKQFEAALVACRRYASRVKDQQTHEKRILSLVAKAKVRLTNRVSVVIVDKPRDYERLYELQKSVKKQRGEFSLIEGGDSIIIVSSDEFADEIQETFRSKIRKQANGLVQILMSFDERIETTPGVVAFVFGLLAENSINVLEEMSCWTDLMMIIDEQDAAKAMKVLSVNR